LAPSDLKLRMVPAKLVMVGGTAPR
jgi:hypothetical protein